MNLLIQKPDIELLDDALKHIQNAMQRAETLNLGFEDGSHFVLHLAMAKQALIDIHPNPEAWYE